MSIKKVIHLTTTHDAMDSRVFQKECRSLAAAGYDVVLIVPHEFDFNKDGVRIKAVPKPVNGKVRIKITTRNVYKAALEEREPGAIFHFHEFELIFYAFRLKREGYKVIYDIHEDMPRLIMIQHWISWWLKPFVYLFVLVTEWIFSNYFTGIIAAEPVIADRFPGKNTVLVQNFALKNELWVKNVVPHEKRKPNFTYVGGLTKERGFFEMVRAIEKINQQNARLLLAGTFYPKNLWKRTEKRKGWARTEYLGFQSREEIADLLAKTKVGLCLLQPNKRYRENYPTKLFEYMSAAIPVIASDTPIMAGIVNETNCGILADPLDTDQIADAMEWMLNNPEKAKEMGENGRQSVLMKYCWENERIKLLRFYENLQDA